MKTLNPMNPQNAGAYSKAQVNGLLNENLGGIRFGKGTDPDTGETIWGYYVYDGEAGTDVLVPFKPAVSMNKVYQSGAIIGAATYTYGGSQKEIYVLAASQETPGAAAISVSPSAVTAIFSITGGTASVNMTVKLFKWPVSSGNTLKLNFTYRGSFIVFEL